MGCPKWEHAPGASLELYVPGEVARQPVGFGTSPPVLFASRHNPGASVVAALLRAGMPAIRIEEETPQPIKRALKALAASVVELGAVSVQSAHNAPAGPAVGDRRSDGTPVTHFLLYLAQETWVGDAGDELAREVRAAREAGMPIVMVHENDMEHGGCEFARFFETTPRDLIQGNLYSALAFALYPGPYLPVSVALVAGALGATTLGGRKKSSLITPAAARDKEAEIRGRAKGQPAASLEGESKGSEMVQAATSIQRVARGRVTRSGLHSKQDAATVQVQMPLPGKIAAQVSPEGTQSGDPSPSMQAGGGT